MKKLLAIGLTVFVASAVSALAGDAKATFESNCAKTGEYEQRVVDYWVAQEAADPSNAFYQEGEIADEAARVCIDAGDLDAAALKADPTLKLGEPEIAVGAGRDRIR